MTIYMTMRERKEHSPQLGTYVVLLAQKRPYWLGKRMYDEINKILLPRPDLLHEFEAEVKKVGSSTAWKIVHFETRYRFALLGHSGAISEIRRLKQIAREGRELVFLTKDSVGYCPYPIVLNDLVNSSIGDQ